MNIAIAGTGYVGLSIATLLAQHHHVTAVDILPEKVDKINRRESPIQDEYIEKYLAEKDLDLTATLDAEAAYREAEFVVIAAPTNYDSKKNFFDTSAVETVIDLVMKANPGRHHGHQVHDPGGLHRAYPKSHGQQKHPVQPGISAGEQGSLRQPLPQPHHRGHRQERPAPRGEGPHLCGAFAGRGPQGEHRHAVHGLHRGGGRQAVCQHLPGAAGELLQRAGHLRRIQGPQHPGHHRRRLPGPPHRQPLQQPQFRLRRLLPAQGHKQLLANYADVRKT